MSDHYPLDTGTPFREPSRRWRWLGWLLIVVLAIGLALVITQWRKVSGTVRMMQKATAIAGQFERVLNLTPEITVDSRVVVAANTPVLELVTMERQEVIQHKFTHTWLHSTKVLELEATFTARAGFDLTAPIRIELDSATGEVFISTPPAKILSVGMSDVRILRDEDGYWNQLTTEDRERAMREMEAAARASFDKSSLAADAQREGEDRIDSLLAQPVLGLPMGLPAPPSPEPLP